MVYIGKVDIILMVNGTAILRSKGIILAHGLGLWNVYLIYMDFYSGITGLG